MVECLDRGRRQRSDRGQRHRSADADAPRHRHTDRVGTGLGVASAATRMSPEPIVRTLSCPIRAFTVPLSLAVAPGSGSREGQTTGAGDRLGIDGAALVGRNRETVVIGDRRRCRDQGGHIRGLARDRHRCTDGGAATNGRADRLSLDGRAVFGCDRRRVGVVASDGAAEVCGDRVVLGTIGDCGTDARTESPAPAEAWIFTARPPDPSAMVALTLACDVVTFPVSDAVTVSVTRVKATAAPTPAAPAPAPHTACDIRGADIGGRRHADGACPPSSLRQFRPSPRRWHCRACWRC